MDTADTPRPHHELARLPELPPALRAPLPPATQSAGAGGGGLAISPRLVLRGLARHWWQALALWIVGTAALAALVFLRYEPTYHSFSLLRIGTSEANPYLTPGQPRTSADHLQTQIQLITSPNVLSSVAIHPDVATVEGVATARDAEAYLREVIRVEPLPGSSLIQISAEMHQPGDAATVVNAVVDAFLVANSEWSNGRTREAIKQLEDYLKEKESEIEAQKRGLFELIEQAEDPAMVSQYLNRRAGGGAGAEEGGQFVVEVSEYKQQLQRLLDLEYAEIEAQAALETARRQAAATDPQVWVERRVEQVFLSDPDVRGLREQVRDIDVQLKEAERRIRNPGDPSLSRLKAQRQRLVGRYDQLWNDLEPALRARLADLEDNPTRVVRQAEAKLAGLATQRALVEAQLGRLELDERSRGTDSLKMSFAQAKLAQLQNMEITVQNRLEALRFDQREGDQILVIAPAEPTSQAQASKRDKYLAMTPLAVLGLVLGLVTLVEMRSGRVGGTDELSGRLAAEVFAVPPLPTARPGARGRLEGPGLDPKFEQFVQQLDHLRVALCGEGGHDGRGRCVLITSAVGGEGKTTLAAQLAVRCAEAGAATVLIDADLRHATLGRLFEVPDCPGLSDVLRGDARLEDALVPIAQVGGCQLLPAGSPEPNPNRVLRGKAFAPMLEQLRRGFDVVIIDTSPVLPVPDALILGRLADGAVLATRHDQSRFPAVERANGLLAGAGIPVLGVVVNGARPSDRRFGGAGYAAYTYRSDRMPGAADEPPAG